MSVLKERSQEGSSYGTSFKSYRVNQVSPESKSQFRSKDSFSSVTKVVTTPQGKLGDGSIGQSKHDSFNTKKHQLVSETIQEEIESPGLGKLLVIMAK